MSVAKSPHRKLDHRLAGRDLVAGLVAHHDVDQHPARTLGHLLRLDDAGGLDGRRAVFRRCPFKLESDRSHLFPPQTGMAFAQFFAGRYEESLSRGHERQPKLPGAQRILMANLAMAGRIAEARRAAGLP